MQTLRGFLVLGILGLMGCQGVVGPLQYRQPKRVDDPVLPVYEQQKLGRDQLALPVESYDAGPATGLLPPNYYNK